MPKIIFNGLEKTKTVTIREGKTILQAAKQGNIALRHKCGGNASCGTCKVYIPNQDNLSSPQPIESRRLGDEEIEKNMRLSCQTIVYGTVEVNIPEDPFRARVRALLEEARSGL